MSSGGPIRALRLSCGTNRREEEAGRGQVRFQKEEKKFPET